MDIFLAYYLMAVGVSIFYLIIYQLSIEIHYNKTLLDDNNKKELTIIELKNSNDKIKKELNRLTWILKDQD